jgi:hypothetical protein
VDRPRCHALRLRIFVDLTEERADGTPVGPPPAIVTAGDDALPLATDGERSGRRLRWLWPALAMTGFLATGALSVALLRKPVMPLLLPTAPPERDSAVARAPERIRVPREVAEAAPTKATGTAATATPTSAAAAPAVTPSPTSLPAATPATAKPSPKTAPRRPAHAKKHARVTPRAG